MKKALSVILCCMLLFLTSCGVQSENTSEYSVVASFYPVYIFTLNLIDGIDSIKAECMADQNIGCLHDYRLLAKDVRLLSDADAFIINGAGMESFIENVYESVDNLTVIDSSVGITLLSEDDGEHEEHEEHEKHVTGHSHCEAANSHIWMSVENAIDQVVNISDGLCKTFPQYEEKIIENCERYIKRLESLNKGLKDAAAGLDGESIISFHEAYDYMARDLNLNIVASIESDEGGEPSAKELSSLAKMIKDDGVKSLFTEPNYKGSAADILKSETGVSVYVLNPVVEGEASLTAYEDIMRENINIIIKAVK